MLFEYQYTIAAIVATVVLLILSYQRRSYSSDSNRIFFSLLYCNLFTAITDMVTFWTISFPENYSNFVLYGSNIVYLLFNCILTATFLRYLASLIGQKSLIRKAWYAYNLSVGVQFILLVTTPFTHGVIYYDESMKYCHGPLMIVVYLIPILLIAIMIGVFIMQKSKFNRYQSITLITLYSLVFIGFVIQRLFSSIDTSTLTWAIALYVLYVVFENPAYYTHSNTRCLNSRALYKQAIRNVEQGKKTRLLIIEMTNKPQNHGIHAEEKIGLIIEAVAELLAMHFGKNIYYIDNGRFILDLKTIDEAAQAAAEEEIFISFAKPIKVNKEDVKITFNMLGCGFQEMAISDDFVDHMIEIVGRRSIDEIIQSGGIAKVLTNQHNYRLIEDMVSEAIDKDITYLMYQPIYDIEKGRISSTEALVRLNDMQHGAISPEQFINIAEHNGKIVALGGQIFEKVCKFISSKDAKATGLEFIEVNISMIQLKQPDMADVFIELMKKYKVDPGCINLEITESVEAVKNAVITANIRKLQDYGVTFSIDDYGSGFSATNYLFQLPINMVKIDKSILWGAMKDKEAMIVLESTMKMVKQLGKKIVVEGAETEEMIQAIIRNNGDYIQGYYYSPPLEEQAFIKYLKAKQTELAATKEEEYGKKIIDISSHIC